MDNQSGFNARSLRYHSTSLTLTFARYLQLICLAKGLIPNEADSEGAQHDLSILDGDFPVTGPVTIADYLEDRYPFPQFMPADPRLRAIARMTIEQALQSTPAQLSPAVPDNGFLFSPHTPTAADAAVAAVLPSSDFAKRTLHALKAMSVDREQACSDSSSSPSPSL